MVCEGPEPPEINSQELSPPPLTPRAVDSDDEDHGHAGYQPLSQGDNPENITVVSDDESEEDDNEVDPPVPPIEPIDQTITREVWSSPRSTDTIQMDNDRAQQVMTAMANFSLPQTSIPEWAKSVSEEQWKETLQDRIDKLKNS